MDGGRAWRLESHKNGSKLEKRDGNVVFASGDLKKTVYTVNADTKLSGITGVRLELLADDKLPKKGPGRNDDGNFVLTELGLKAISTGEGQSRKSTKVSFKDAKADFNQKDFDVKKAIDGKVDNSGWASHPKLSTDRTAIFIPKEKFGAEGGSRLTFSLNQNYSSNKHSIGKFRLLVTTDEKVEIGHPGDIGAILATASTSGTTTSASVSPITSRHRTTIWPPKTRNSERRRKNAPRIPN